MGIKILELSAEDDAALRKLNSDISDIPPQVVAAYRDGEREGYLVAQRIAEGTLDPLDA
jgi:hypothetical protein